MRKATKGFLIGLAVTALAVVIALPVVVPPLVENFIRAKADALGLPAPYAKMLLGYCWRNGPGLSGVIRIAFPNTPWRVSAEFGCSCSEWSASVKMPAIPFDEKDTVLAALLERHPVTAVSNLVFSGSVALDARAERTFRRPVPVWSARLPIRGLNADFTLAGKPYAVKGFSVTAGADGIADHLDIAPMHPRATALAAAGFTLTNFFASVSMTERTLQITQAAAGLCGGTVSLYSLFLDPKKLNAGFTLFVDDVETGEMLGHLNGFRGDASGRLHGKIRLFVRDGGRSIRLGDAFLYSTPGETGKLKLTDPTPVTDNLALAGLGEDVRDNVANALTDLDYSVLRLNLKRGEGRNATLSTTIRGTATRGKLTVPVDITINFNSELERLINTGLGYKNLLKGKLK